MNEFTRRGLIFGAATAAAYGVLVAVERVCLSAFADDTEPESDSDPVKIVKFSDDGTKLGIYTLARVRKNKSEWKKQLTPLQYDVTRRAATEFAFSGVLYDRSTINMLPGCTAALIAPTRSSIRKRNSTPARAGRVSGKPSPRRMSGRKKTSAWARFERK